MKKNMFFLYLLASLFVFSCGKKNEENTENKEPDNTEQVDKEQTFEDFWGKFQQAVAAKDKAKIMAMTNFMELDNADFESYFDDYFSDENRAMFAKVSAGELEKTEDQFENLQVTDTRSFAVKSSSLDAEGNKLESAYFFIFGKVGKEYMLVYINVAG